MRLRLLVSGCHLGQLRCLSDWLGNGFGSRSRKGRLVFTTPPPRNTWLHFSPRSICPAEGPARLAFGAAWWLVATVGDPEETPLLRGLPSPLSIAHNPGSSLCGCPRKCSTEAVLGGLGSHQKGESPHTLRTEERVRSFAAYGRSAGSVWIGLGPLVPSMSPPTLSGHRAL